MYYIVLFLYYNEAFVLSILTRSAFSLMHTYHIDLTINIYVIDITFRLILESQKIKASKAA
jgi:hypothetical protein